MQAFVFIAAQLETMAFQFVWTEIFFFCYVNIDYYDCLKTINPGIQALAFFFLVYLMPYKYWCAVKFSWLSLVSFCSFESFQPLVLKSAVAFVWRK